MISRIVQIKELWEYIPNKFGNRNKVRKTRKILANLQNAFDTLDQSPSLEVSKRFFVGLLKISYQSTLEKMKRSRFFSKPKMNELHELIP